MSVVGCRLSVSRAGSAERGAGSISVFAAPSSALRANFTDNVDHESVLRVDSSGDVVLYGGIYDKSQLYITTTGDVTFQSDGILLKSKPCESRSMFMNWIILESSTQ